MDLARTDLSPATPQLAAPTHPARRRWAGRALTGIAAAFLALDAVGKLLALPPVVAGTVRYGYPAGVVVYLGLVLLGCVAVHLVPRTAVLGAILLTGYLGGAVATHVRVGDPLLSHVLFPIYVGALIWGGLFLRDARVRALVSLAAARG